MLHKRYGNEIGSLLTQLIHSQYLIVLLVVLEILEGQQTRLSHAQLLRLLT